MNKFYHVLRNALLIASIWWVAMLLFGEYRVEKYGVKPMFPYYETLIEETNPAAAAWAHFDGAHYLHIAKLGYDGTGIQAFFPVYPFMIRGLHSLSGIPYIAAGKVISFLSLIGTLVCITYLFGARARLIIAALLLFPTCFFLASMYTESLFLFEVLLFFVLLKRGNYLGAAAIAGLASGTRLVGVLLSLSLLVELYRRPLSIIHKSLLMIISVSGFLAYALYLGNRYGDPFIFLHVQSLFGAERSSGEIVWLPQVLVRYGLMIATVDSTTWLYQRVWLELLTFLGAIWLWSKNLRYLPITQSLFVAGAILLPTLSGTLSSFPRYVLVLVPFLLPPRLAPRGFIPYLALSSLALAYLTAQYVSGLFVA